MLSAFIIVAVITVYSPKFIANYRHTILEVSKQYTKRKIYLAVSIKCAMLLAYNVPCCQLTMCHVVSLQCAMLSAYNVPCCQHTMCHVVSIQCAMLSAYNVPCCQFTMCHVVSLQCCQHIMCHVVSI